MNTAEFKRPFREPDWYDEHHATGARRFASPKDAYFEVLDHFPFWTKSAMRLRNLAMRPFGLQTEPPEGLAQGRNALAALPPVQDTPTVYEAGMKDKHLTFTIETRFEGDIIAIRTNIWFNHPLGRAYLAAVYVPHKIIVRSAARGVSHASRH